MDVTALDRCEQGNAAEALTELRRSIRTAATEAIQVFVARTGLYPSGISIEIVDSTSFVPGEPARTTAVSDVRVRIES